MVKISLFTTALFLQSVLASAQCPGKPVRRCGMGEKPQADTSKIRSHEVHNYFKGQVIDFVYNAECVLDDKFENNRGRLPWPVSKGYLLMPYGSNTPGSIN
ncbi:MAG TPA: hypothetical protein VKH37_09365, partial [Ferruginibacter sp.]|nr:hypothetical protein [Ferruginibacter sp.]